MYRVTDINSTAVIRPANSLLARYFFLIGNMIFCVYIPIWYFIWERDGAIESFDWKLNFFRVSYLENGFIRRGLVGTIFDVLHLSANYITMGLFSLLVLQIFLYCSSLILRKVDEESPQDALFIRSFVLVSPYTCFQASYDLGRFDMLVLAALMGSIALVNSGRFLALMVLSMVSLLVHEMFFVVCVPVIIASMIGRYFGSKESSSIELARTVFYAISVILIALGLFRFGGSTELASTVSRAALPVWQRGMLEPALGPGGYKTVIMIFLMAAAYAFLLASYRYNSASIDLSALASLAPLSLFVLGTDSSRWLAVTHCVILAVLVEKIIIKNWKLPLRSSWYYSWIVLLPIGPAGVQDFFPLVSLIIKHAPIASLR